MMAHFTITYPTALVLQALSRGYHYGFDIMDATNLPSGTVYPILRRLDREGLVRSRWEKAEVAQREQRPPRRYYELAAAGERVLADAAGRYRALEAIAPREGRRLKAAREPR
jgi:DNA-binding PadR family transcriptional regulator